MEIIGTQVINYLDYTWDNFYPGNVGKLPNYKRAKQQEYCSSKQGNDFLIILGTANKRDIYSWK